MTSIVGEQTVQKSPSNPSVAWTTILSFLSGIGAAYFTVWITSTEPHLTKSTAEIIPFQGDKGEVGIINLRVANDGTKEAEDTEGIIKVAGSSIEDVKVVPDILHAEKILKGDVFEIKVKLLNPKSEIQVSALVKKSSGMPYLPVVEFRAKGVEAEPKPRDISWEWNLGKTMLGMVVSFSCSHSLERCRTRQKTTKKP